ncbi:MAG TPA: methyltransferase domain-containing protein, partial [Bacteroidia bacterium]|nr:methyltransferase domain-containing protein [Bacteroidia bacterium]
PAPGDIDSMIAAYYDEQADEYDEFDRTHKKRKQYLDGINKIIAEDYKKLDKLDTMLALAGGTGRRALDIQELSGRNFKITSVDISAEMTEVAQSTGIDAIAGDWVRCDLQQTGFDAATFLYAFGHICNWEERRVSLKKVYDHLLPGAPFYLDVFNIDDQNEWGPPAVKLYNELHLAEMGYEPGDVFYKKYGGKAVSYLHYFKKDNLVSLLEQCGFTIEWVKNIGYNVNPGEVLPEGQEGVLFVKAVKG